LSPLAQAVSVIADSAIGVCPLVVRCSKGYLAGKVGQDAALQQICKGWGRSEARACDRHGEQGDGHVPENDKVVASHDVPGGRFGGL
jgi:hypothetical protein